MAVPVNPTIQTQIANLYIAILGRNPEPLGFSYWTDTLANNNGTSAALNAITLGFSNSPEFTATYGGQTTPAAIGLMYTNVLGRTADTAGLNYWVGIANNYMTAAGGGYTVQQALALTGNSIITSAAANTGTQDQVNIQAKQAVAITSGTSAPTQTYTLTTSIETVNAGNNDVNGVIDNGIAAGQTFQSGDTINNAKNINVTVAGTNATAPAVAINTAASVNFTNLVNQTVEASLWTGVAAVRSTSNIAGTVLTVNNGALATTYGVAGTPNAGGLTVALRAADLTGTANTMNLTAAGAGSIVASAGVAPVLNAQTITMASTGVEAVALATTGTNVLTLIDNPAVGVATDYASLTITGAGANTIDVSALTQTLTYNAATATGNTTLNFGTALQSNATITGGTATGDAIRVNQGTTVAGITITGVETLRSSVGGSTGTIAFNAGSSLTTLRVDGDAAEGGVLTLINPGAIATVNYIGAGLTADLNTAQQFKGVSMTGAFAGAADTMTLNLSNAGTSQLAGYQIDPLTINGVEALVVNVTQADVAARATFAGLAGGPPVVPTNPGLISNTLQTVTFNSPAAVTAFINATPVAGNSALSSVNLAAIATATAQSVVNLTNGSVGLATQVLGATGTGGTQLILGAEVAGDVLIFTGGQGNDRIDGNGFTGTLTASMGQGVNAINTGDGTTITIATLSGAGSANTITGGTGADTITVVASGLGSTNTVTGGGGADNINASSSTIAVSITTGDGASRLTGGAAGDTLVGATAAGGDTFVGNAGNDTIRTGTVTGTVATVITGGLGADAIALQAAGAQVGKVVTMNTTAADSFATTGQFDTATFADQATNGTNIVTLVTGVLTSTLVGATTVNIGVTTIAAGGVLAVGSASATLTTTNQNFQIYQDSNLNGIIDATDLRVDFTDVAAADTMAVALVAQQVVVTSTGV